VERDERAATPLPWEQKAAIGCLALLSLQEFHEGILFCLGKTAPGFYSTSSAFAVLLAFFVALGCGLLFRSRFAWWTGVLLLGFIALIHVSVVWPAIWQSLRFDGRVRSAASYEWFQSVKSLDAFEILWLAIRSVLMMAIPPLLVLGEVRSKLRRD
jgi:hypothetical protein